MDNTSLSARIKRRNRQGFKGVGKNNYKLVPATKPLVPSYLNEEYNHKSNDSRKKVASILCEAKKIGLIGKHSGSKPLMSITKNIRHFHIGTRLHDAYLQYLKKLNG